MFLAVRPFLRMIGHIYHNKEVIDKALVALMFLLLIVSSYFTEILGLHALFRRLYCRRGHAREHQIPQDHDGKGGRRVIGALPAAFFVSTGLRTEIGLLNTPELWVMCGIFIVVAIIGKFGELCFPLVLSVKAGKTVFTLGL